MAVIDLETELRITNADVAVGKSFICVKESKRTNTYELNKEYTIVKQSENRGSFTTVYDVGGEDGKIVGHLTKLGLWCRRYGTTCHSGIAILVPSEKLTDEIKFYMKLSGTL